MIRSSAKYDRLISQYYWLRMDSKLLGISSIVSDDSNVRGSARNHFSFSFFRIMIGTWSSYRSAGFTLRITKVQGAFGCFLALFSFRTIYRCSSIFICEWRQCFSSQPPYEYLAAENKKRKETAAVIHEQSSQNRRKIIIKKKQFGNRRTKWLRKMVP